ncbi:uncharacterized protein LOC132750091 [Ruditapes philippinarum]|uniref:uncharacterized protein LOC132750091 n=1 Tax=Ruditapes philippinarum TaxID=129788 RepID=UPI00295AE833|nr:uncharacterized protein LOC132750091 [Ruditapes philippinarum]
MEATSKKASVHGLNTSLDTEGAVCANKALTNARKLVLPDDHDLGALCASITVADTGKPLPDEHDQDGKAKNDVSLLRVSNYGHSSGSSTERRRRSEKELEKDNLTLDNKRIKLDTERIIKETYKLEKETAKIEKETAKIEKETVKIEKEIENIKLKKSILELMLSRLAEDPHSVSLLDKFDFDF